VKVLVTWRTFSWSRWVPIPMPGAPAVVSDATNKWHGRPWLARALRAGVHVVPFALSVAAAYLLSDLIPAARTVPGAILRFVGIAAVATGVLYGVDKLARRLLPLAALLDLTLLFPDQAPSRYRLALRSGGTGELRRRLDDYMATGADSAATAAERLLELVGALSKHDRLTRGHSERVRAYSQMLGAELGLTEDELDKIRWAGLIHDIGKLRVPAEILNKPGKLTAEEYEVIKRHPVDGAVLADPLGDWLGDSVRAVAEHHERWDGTGYPYGLAGTEISFAARIVAVADAYDVMTSARSYKAPMSPAAARAELARCAGTQFDPVVVRAFLNLSLGRLRVAMGPLSWLAQLSLFPQALLSTAAAPAVTAVTAAAGLTAASVGSVIIPDATGGEARAVNAVALDGDVPLAFDVGDGYAGLAPVVVASTTTVDAGSAAPGGERPGDDAVTTTTERWATTTLAPTSTASPDATELPAPTTTERPPSDTKPPTATATTTPSPPTITKPPPPLTTVAATTTTTTVPAPTTTVPTTAPGPPPPSVYLLAAAGPGDQPAQDVLPIVGRAPLNVSLTNLDADRNGDPGLTIARGGTIADADATEVQRFRLDPAGRLRLDGPASLSLWATSRNQVPGLMRVGVAVMRCNDSNGKCTPMAATQQVDFDGGQWTSLTIDLGSLVETVAVSRNLQLWIVVDSTSAADAWIGFDAADCASALSLTVVT
jgi:hypothetical protein